MQHEFGVCVDELDQSEQEALVASSVEFCGFLFEFKAVGHFPFEGQTLEHTHGPESDLHQHEARTSNLLADTSPCPLTVVVRSGACVPAPWITRLSVSENIKRSSPE